MKTYWPILSYVFLFPSYLLVWFAVTIINPCSACFIDLHVGRINPGRCGTALTSRCSGVSRAFMPLSHSIFDSSSPSQLSSHTFGWSKSRFQFSQFLVFEKFPDALSSSLSAGWQLILLIRRTFDTLVHSPGMCIADKASSKGDLTDNLNAAAPSCWKFDQDALMICSVSEMYPTTVICVIWAQDSFCIACRFWLPCHISKKSWTMAILCNVLSSTCFFNSKSFSVSVVSNAVQSPANIPLLAPANCVSMSFSWRVSPVVLDCLQPITSRPRENLAYTLTPCSMIENMSHATL